MHLSVAMPPGPRAVEHARARAGARLRPLLALRLGRALRRRLDLAGPHRRAHRLDIGTAVLVPNLRHVMTTASAIATIEGLAPGRLACGFGTGATARWVLNKKALSWATTRRYLEQLRGLLRGEVVEIDGERCQMIHHPDWAAARPIDTPLLVSALGPKGIEQVGEMRAAGVIDGFIGMADVDVDSRAGPHDRGHRARPRRVDRERPGAGRARPLVRRAVPRRLAGVPRRGGRHATREEWLAGIAAERPEGERHLVVHEGHVTNVMPRDRGVLAAAGDALATTGWVGRPTRSAPWRSPPRPRATPRSCTRRPVTSPARCGPSPRPCAGSRQNSTSSSSSSSGSSPAAAIHSRIAGSARIASQ